MSDERDMTGEDELDLLAGEYALGLLEGAHRGRADGLIAADADFRRRVARWSGRLAPLLDPVEPAPPPPGLWARIELAIGPAARPGLSAQAPASNVHVLRRKINLWRGYSAAATASTPAAGARRRLRLSGS